MICRWAAGLGKLHDLCKCKQLLSIYLTPWACRASRFQFEWVSETSMHVLKQTARLKLNSCLRTTCIELALNLSKARSKSLETTSLAIPGCFWAFYMRSKSSKNTTRRSEVVSAKFDKRMSRKCDDRDRGQISSPSDARLFFSFLRHSTTSSEHVSDVLPIFLEKSWRILSTTSFGQAP